MTLNTIIRCLVLCCVATFATSTEAVTVAFNSFEGDSGELNFTSSVVAPADGQVITQNSLPIQHGLISLMADKIGVQPQTDFMIDFDPVDLTGLTDVALSFWWHANINDNNYENGFDFLEFTITHDGTGSPIVTTFDGNALNAARNGTSTDEWQQLFEVIPDDATTLSFSVLANFNTPTENIFFDNLTITGNLPPVPEPSSILLLGLGAIGLVQHTRRRKEKA